jgi:hypothetical protein
VMAAADGRADGRRVSTKAKDLIRDRMSRSDSGSG